MSVSLRESFLNIRAKTLHLCEGLLPEDFSLQAMEEVSPPKWHLGHTSWFFEQFILITFTETFEVFNPLFNKIFNSYYEGHGKPYPRNQRGLLSRPDLETVKSYRNFVDQAILDLWDRIGAKQCAQFEELVRVGLHHEQQHQELLLMDALYNFSKNPLLPGVMTEQQISTAPTEFHSCSAYVRAHPIFQVDSESRRLILSDMAITQQGYCGEEFLFANEFSRGFCFDNETPSHVVALEPFAVDLDLVTNEEYLEFVLSGGYNKHEYWLSEGFSWVNDQAKVGPLYWNVDGEFDFSLGELDVAAKANSLLEFGLYGNRIMDLKAPVTHINYFEANAFAAWKKRRLPTEQEWEAAARFVVASPELKAHQSSFLASRWQWVQSSYQPYPNYAKPEGTIGEYNGKFMVNQYVLRGGSCVTPEKHQRLTYRNFFATSYSWMFSGIRLAGKAN